MTNLITAYAVYTLTPRGCFSKKYEGASLEAAEKAYEKLSGKARLLNKIEGGLQFEVKSEGIF